MEFSGKKTPNFFTQQNSSEKLANSKKNFNFSANKKLLTFDNSINSENNNDDYNMLLTESSKINLIKNPPNLLEICNTYDDDNLILQNENIKLRSELTISKSKLIKLNGLLKDKERENEDLKRKIYDMKKILEKYGNQQKNKSNDKIEYYMNQMNTIYENANIEKNNLKETYESMQKKKDLELEQINKQFTDIKNILNLFFEFFNKNLELFIITKIIDNENFENINFNKDNMETNYKNSILIIELFNNLINKLVNDNKFLFDELNNYKQNFENNGQINYNENSINNNYGLEKQDSQRISANNQSQFSSNLYPLQNDISNNSGNYGFCYNNDNCCYNRIYDIGNNFCFNNYEQDDNNDQPIEEMKKKINEIENRLRMRIQSKKH